MENETRPAGRPLAVDFAKESASTELPGFLARPRGAPVYHGFKVLDDVVVDGFVFGAITDFETAELTEGDAFVVAPDNSRAGLVWEVSPFQQFTELCPLERDRWGVWGVSFPFKMASRANVRLNLQAVLPLLRPRWEEWRRKYRGAD